MAEETEPEKKTKKKNQKEKKEKKGFLKELKIAYSTLEDRKKFFRSILLPLVMMGVMVFALPFVLGAFVSVPLDLNPITFIIGGIIPIFLGIFYPYISWKNKANDIDGKMHFLITHLRVLAISDLSLKDIIHINDILIDVNNSHKKPVVAILAPGLGEIHRLEIEEKLVNSGIPVFPSIDRAAKALNNLKLYSSLH